MKKSKRAASQGGKNNRVNKVNDDAGQGIAATNDEVVAVVDDVAAASLEAVESPAEHLESEIAHEAEQNGAALDIAEDAAQSVVDEDAADASEEVALDLHDSEQSLDIDGELSLDLDNELSLDIDGEPSLDIDSELSLDIDSEPSLGIDSEPSLDIDSEPSLDIDSELSLGIDSEPSLDISPPVLGDDFAPTPVLDPAFDLPVEPMEPVFAEPIASIFEPVAAYSAPEYGWQQSEIYEAAPVAFETAPAAGPPRHAGKIAIAFGLAIILIGGVGAVANVLQLLNAPPTLQQIDTDPTLPITDPDVTEEEPEEEIVIVQVARAVIDSRVRAGADRNAQPVGGIPADDLVEITGEPQYGWYPIDYQGLIGWVWGPLLTDFSTMPANELAGGAAALEAAGEPILGTSEAAPIAQPTEAPEPTQAPTPTQASRAGERVRAIQAVYLRSTPSTNREPLAVIYNGADVVITGPESNGWIPITYQGQSGWAAVHAFN